VPFYAYYWSTEFNATTQLFRKAAIFVPLGMLLARGFHLVAASAWARLLYAAGATALVMSAAAIIELGQVALPGKVADPTDAALGVLGALAGVVLMSWLTRLARPSARRRGAA
jgi:glycopeptide antibiotics resistance protein